jgi:hypothetical protein
VSDKNESFSTTGLYVSAGTWVTCHRYPDKTPILSIQAGRSEFSISIKDRNADDAAVEFARALVCNVQSFAAEVERLHAAKTAPSESADQAA